MEAWKPQPQADWTPALLGAGVSDQRCPPFLSGSLRAVGDNSSSVPCVGLLLMCSKNFTSSVSLEVHGIGMHRGCHQPAHKAQLQGLIRMANQGI